MSTAAEMRARIAERRARHEAMARVELAAPTFPPKLLLSEYSERAPRCPACRGVIRRSAIPGIVNLMCSCGWRAAEIAEVSL